MPFQSKVRLTFLLKLSVYSTMTVLLRCLR